MHGVGMNQGTGLANADHSDWQEIQLRDAAIQKTLIAHPDAISAPQRIEIADQYYQYLRHGTKPNAN